MSTSSGRKRTLRRPSRERRSFCSSPYVRFLRCELLEDRRLLAQIPVTTDLDIVDFNDGETSLREAVFAANIVPGADEIVFDFGHDGPAKILLTQGELKIIDSLTITGPGAELLTVDNSLTQGPIFDIDNLAFDTIIDVGLSGMTLTGSKNSAIRAVEAVTVEDMIFHGNRGASGAGILMSTEGTQTQNIKLTVRNSRFEDNRTVSTTGFTAGGGISFFGRFGELTIENTSFVGNLGTNGGGLSVIGFGNLVNITDSDFVDNDAVRGGGIFIADDNAKLATLSRVDVRDNTGALAGGGIYVAGKSVTILDSDITGNRTTNSNGQTGGGGGIYKLGNDAFIVGNSRISDNHSFNDGGGIAIVGSGLQLTDTVVDRNTAVKRGGGILLFSGANVEITRSTLSGNIAGASGGGLYSRGPSNSDLRLFDSTVSGNSAAGSGGGLSVNSGTFLLQNSTVSGNEAGSNGGGLIIARGTRQSTIAHSTITDNTSDADENGMGAGGGLFSDTSPAIVIGHTIIANNHDNTGTSPDVKADFVPTNSLIGAGAEFLGPLADNGGPTMTHALLPGSPAIDAGDSALTTVSKFDQRGYPFVRIFGAAIDIGAFEAQSLVVNTLVDEIDGDDSAGDLSLREAIELANKIDGANTIEFSPMLAGGTIFMTMGEYTITDAVEIVGPGAELLIIDAQQKSRIFNVTATKGDFMFSGMTLIRGSTSEAGAAFGGGAIRSASSGLVSIHGMRLVGNRTLGNDAGGGAIYAAGPLDVEGTVFLENTTTGSNAVGGAIYAARDITISGSNLNANQTFGPNAGGGGVFALQTLTVDATSFINNRTNGSNSFGGGINASTLVMSSSTVSGNSTNAINAPGGGISVGGPRGGGSPSLIVDSIIIDNYTVGSNSPGGGISAGGVTIERSTISGNLTVSSNSGGGGLYAVAGTLRDCTFVENRTYGSGSNGGGAGGRAFRQEWQITNSSFHGNEALGNNACGGALFLIAAVSVTGSNFENNSAPTGGGGAIYVAGIGAPYVSVYSSHFKGNLASFGGAIRSQGTMNIVDSVLSDNRAVSSLVDYWQGGGAIFQSGSLSISRTKITENQASGFNNVAGGGIRAMSHATIVQCEISNNRVIGSGTGGGIYCALATITDSTISGNQIIGSGSGGGIYLSGPSSLFNSTISGNQITGEQSRGGGVFATRGIEMRHSTVTNNWINSPTGETGGLWVAPGGTISSPSMISHSIVAGNFVGTSASDLRSRPQLSHSLIGTNAGTQLSEAPIGSPDENGNLIGGPLHGVINPLLAPLTDNGGPTKTHALRPGSPAINAGDPALAAGVQGTPLFDQRGAPFARVADGRIDIGAYESQPESGLYSGDFDGDGDVDGRDFLAWQRGYGFQSSPPHRTTGDATENGVVDGNDLRVWQETYGNEPSKISSQLNVPSAESVISKGVAASVEVSGQLKQSGFLHYSSGERTLDEPRFLGSQDSPRNDIYHVAVDRALEHWAPLKRSSIDFSDIVTRRPIKRRA